MKGYTGWLDSTLLPYRYKNCTFNFPKLTQNQYKRQPPGLLIKLLRLNVPCTSNGFINFNNTIRLCGKLEELTDSQRTLYFHSFSNTIFNIYNYPKFHFIYKLVDFCYNITLLDHNSSFVIQPTSRLALKCHFKIHLPFGNEIALKLRLNSDANMPTSPTSTTKTTIIRDIHMKRITQDDEHPLLLDYIKIEDEFIELENFLPNSGATFASHTNNDCNGILIEIVNRMNEMWSECLEDNLDPAAKIEYKLTSSDNVLLIRMTKKSKFSSTTVHNRELKDEQISNMLINLEYTAVPIDNIVSQCAFGWILIGQYCMVQFTELKTWDEAESKCNTLGGHLASINSDNEQHLIDMFLLNG